MTVNQVSLGGAVSAFRAYEDHRSICSGIVQEIVKYALDQIAQTRRVIRSLSSPLALLSDIQFNEALRGLMNELKHLSLLNKEQPISKDKKQEMVKRIKAFIINANDSDLLLLMKLIAQNITAISLELFVEVLNKLKTRHPQLNEYIIGWDPILTPKAINNLISIFENQFGFEKGILSTQSIEDVPILITEILNAYQDGIKACIAYNPDEKDPHLVPVFIQKKENKTKVFICNSLGHDIHLPLFQPLVLKKIIEKSYKFTDLDNLQIFSYKPVRQNDSVSCPIFALLDLKNIYEGLKEGRDIFEFLQSNGNPKNIMPEIQDDSDLKIYEVDQLPPDMMKVTQSYTRLRSYSMKSSTFTHSPPSFDRISPVGLRCRILQDEEQLNKKITDYKCIASDGTPRNKYIERKRLNWIVLLISRFLQSDF